MKNMKKFDRNNDAKIYILIFCSIVLCSILISLNTIPLYILGLSYNDIGIFGAKLYTFIYYVFAGAVSVFFFLSWKDETYEKIIEQTKKYLIGIGSIIIYFLLSKLEILPFQLLDIDYAKIPLYLKIIYLLVYQIFLILIIVYINNKKLKKDIDDIKINHKKYFKRTLKYWLISLFIMYISNFLIQIMNSGIATNEQIIRDQFQVSPIYIFISAVILAPVLEELIFRQSFRNLFRNKWLFVVISGLVFGSMHAFTGGSFSLINFLYLIPYSAPGMAFALMLYETDNIFVSMGFHMLHNGIMVGLQFLLFFFL